MRRHGVDMWIVQGASMPKTVCMRSMLPGIRAVARRTMILIFMIAAKGAGWSGSRHPVPVGDLFAPAWDPRCRKSMGARRRIGT
jgi:hypothetical protein